MTPYYYEIFYRGDHTSPEYKGIVLAANEEEAHRKAKQWYISHHGGELPGKIEIGLTIE